MIHYKYIKLLTYFTLSETVLSNILYINKKIKKTIPTKA